MRISNTLAHFSLISLMFCVRPSLASLQESVAGLEKGMQITNNQNNNLQPFTTDGCSMWIDGTMESPNLWRHCCVAHDKAYWIGGALQEREKADQLLQSCVSDVAGKGMGNYMYAFVMAGGSPFWLTPYRWGYGWSYLDKGKPRGYKILTEEELIQVTMLLPQAEIYIAEDALKHPVVGLKTLQK